MISAQVGRASLGPAGREKLERQVKELRGHMAENVKSFQAEAFKARQALREVAMQSVEASRNEDMEEEQALPAAGEPLSADLGAHIAQVEHDLEQGALDPLLDLAIDLAPVFVVREQVFDLARNEILEARAGGFGGDGAREEIEFTGGEHFVG